MRTWYASYSHLTLRTLPCPTPPPYPTPAPPPSPSPPSALLRTRARPPLSHAVITPPYSALPCPPYPQGRTPTPPFPTPCPAIPHASRAMHLIRGAQIKDPALCPTLPSHARNARSLACHPHARIMHLIRAACKRPKFVS